MRTLLVSDDGVEPVAQPACVLVRTALADALDAVEPGVTRIAGLKARAGIDLVQPVRTEAHAAAVLAIDDGAVVGAERRAHIERTRLHIGRRCHPIRRGGAEQRSAE